MAKNKSYSNIVKIVILLTVLLTLVSCNCMCSGEYKKVTVRKSTTSYSFEYPVSYEDPFGSLQEGFPEDSILLLRPYADKWYSDTAFSITVESSGGLFPSAQAALDRLLYSYEHPIYDNRFVLLERSSVEVSGSTGEIIVFSIMMAPDYYLGPHPAVGREIFFDRNGMIWDIALYSHETIAQQTESEFERILETFQILD